MTAPAFPPPTTPRTLGPLRYDASSSSRPGLTPEDEAAMRVIEEWAASSQNASGVTGPRAQPQVGQSLQAVDPSDYGPQSLIDFAESSFYVPETAQPIQLEHVQKVILWCMFDHDFAIEMGCPMGFQDIIYSTVKKSGKTTVAALVARWVTERWGRMNEIYCLANDVEQARGRIYDKVQKSIELDPRYDSHRQELPSQWDIVQRELRHLPTRSTIRSLANDFRGEAGSNPTATFWSELWGYVHEASRRFWDELTPVPTRPHSIRMVETYAGFENESGLLTDHYRLATDPEQGARRLTRDDVPFWPDDQPDEYELPLYVNPVAQTIAYWDTGAQARRMPWQVPAYYQAQAKKLRPAAFDRLHNNFWTTSVEAFVQPEWWYACHVDRLPLDSPLPEWDPRQPCVVAADASVSGDSTGLALVTRHPKDPTRVVVRLSREWVPPSGGTINYGQLDPPGLEVTARDWFKRYNVVCFTYDPYQLHDMGTRFGQEGVVWAKPFTQGDRRMVADYQLFTFIRDRLLVHSSDMNDPLTKHIKNADARISAKENTKLRIVKKTEDAKIDLAVALSMATYECKRLMLS